MRQGVTVVLLMLLGLLVLAGCGRAGLGPAGGFDAGRPLRGPVIPGLDDGFVPQGLGLLGDGSFLISGYGAAYEQVGGQVVGPVSVWRLWRDGRAREIRIQHQGARLHSHGCGVVVHGGRLYLSGGRDGRIYVGDWDAAANTISVTQWQQYPVPVDVLSVDADGALWTAQFFKSASPFATPLFRTKDPNGIAKFALALRLDAATGAPLAAVAIRQRVQGISVTGHNLLLSTSYGQNGPAQLTLYALPLSWPATDHGDIAPWGRVPVHQVVARAGDAALQESPIPPMSQGIAIDDQGVVWVLNESGNAGRFADARKRTRRLLGYVLQPPAD